MSEPGDSGSFNRQKVWDNRDVYTSTASSLTRQLAFAGIAVIWLFRIGGDSSNIGTVPSTMRLPLLLVLLALAADLLQYVYGSVAWAIFGWVMERRVQKGEATEPFLAPRSINWAPWFFFCTKIVLVIWSYAVLASRIGGLIF